ncbi:MAG: hypothetical protein AAF212_10835 [Verrucomicrobiota bacterium]
MRLPIKIDSTGLFANAPFANNQQRRTTIPGNIIPQADAVQPAVTQAERDEAQAYINAHCHNLQPCTDDEPCQELRNRGNQANECVSQRFIVRKFYDERDILEPEEDQAAIEHDDNTAQTCLTYYNQHCVDAA